MVIDKARMMKIASTAGWVAVVLSVLLLLFSGANGTRRCPPTTSRWRPLESQWGEHLLPPILDWPGWVGPSASAHSTIMTELSFFLQEQRQWLTRSRLDFMARGISQGRRCEVIGSNC